MKIFVNAAIALAAVVSVPAHAAPVNLDIAFDATDFDNAPAPYGSVHGDFSFSFDNAASFEGTTTGLTVNSFTLPSPPYAVYFAYQQVNDTLILSDFASSKGCGASPNDNNYCTFIENVSTAPAIVFFYYSAAQGLIYRAGTVTYGPSTPAPEPAAWAMMIAGFGMIGVALRRRSTRIALAI